MQLEKVYEPQRFEPHWAQWWIDSGIFEATAGGSRRIFSLVIPPPNVTGLLHMGHMLEHTEIDVAVRWHRMSGDNTLWLPGMDHAGIATQLVVERKLREEGLDRREIGREEFERRVWKWKAESGGAIKRQMIRLGASCDWSRERFTLDPGLSRAVREVFVSLYEKGLIYRGLYLVNWCPSCLTAISDLEVAHQEMPGHLWRIRYPIAGPDRNQYLVVATTRPETMLGDTAIAVNAQDARYFAFHGKNVRVPLTGREIPIILDDIADPQFGTGAVKITPAHDPNDFEAGKRHGLPHIQVIDESGRMSLEAGPFAGMDRFEARRKVVEALQAEGLLDGVDDHTLSAGVCDRCRTVIEPLASNQWFVKMKPLAAKAIEAVETKAIEIVPENWSKTYFEWMYNIRDWCVSRQLWWGHRIPAWYCERCGELIVSREDPSACPVCNSGELRQEPDVLDTWFSSGLWPFSTLGWPDRTEDLKTFYPTTLLITGFDILFFWVARMIMFGIEFMGEIPFRQVYIHGLVRDADRQKMSKTKGNVVDPLEVTEQYGTDAVRMTLLLGAAPGSDIVFAKDRLESSRAFANKIWNAARFLAVNMERCAVDSWAPEDAAGYKPEGGALEDRWIFSRLNDCVLQTNSAIAANRFHDVAQNIWHFFWDDFCDWYIELKKLRFQENSGLNGDWRNLLAAFETAMRLLHPVMPFLTEELWQRLTPPSPSRPVSIAVAPFPLFREGLADRIAERDMGMLQAALTKARNERAERKIDPKLILPAKVYASEELLYLASEQKQAIEKFASVTAGLPETLSASGFEIVLEVPADLRGAQQGRLLKEREQLTKVIENSERQLGDETFLGRAPARVVDSLRQKLGDYRAQRKKIDDTLAGDAS